MQYCEVAFPQVLTVTMTVHDWGVIDDFGGSGLMAIAEFQASTSALVRSFVWAIALPRTSRLTIGKPNLQRRVGTCSTCSRGWPEFQTLLHMRLCCQGIDVWGLQSCMVDCMCLASFTQRLLHSSICVRGMAFP
jgi:hypothetical protein